jgi:hypothetical protein
LSIHTPDQADLARPISCIFHLVPNDPLYESTPNLLHSNFHSFRTIIISVGPQPVYNSIQFNRPAALPLSSKYHNIPNIQYPIIISRDPISTTIIISNFLIHVQVYAKRIYVNRTYIIINIIPSSNSSSKPYINIRTTNIIKYIYTTEIIELIIKMREYS